MYLASSTYNETVLISEVPGNELKIRPLRFVPRREIGGGGRASGDETIGRLTCVYAARSYACPLVVRLSPA